MINQTVNANNRKIKPLYIGDFSMMSFILPGKFALKWAIENTGQEFILR